MSNNTSPLIYVGLGIGAGVCILQILLSIWPLLAIGGAAYLVYKGITKTTQENYA